MLQKYLFRRLRPGSVDPTACPVLSRCPGVHSSAIKACGPEGRWEEALGLLAEMQGVGVRPNLITYTGGTQFLCVDCWF